MKRRFRPLSTTTPSRWAAQALADPVAFLCDHAHLERKAANNALALVDHAPDDLPSGRWEQILSGVARDETRHLGQVLRLLRERGGRWTRHHRNPYAATLMGSVNKGDSRWAMLDRLLVSGLIEARSCERFGVLARHAADPELARFFAGLLRSERGHHEGFLVLASLVTDPATAEARWDEWVDLEARTLAVQEPGCRMFSGA